MEIVSFRRLMPGLAVLCFAGLLLAAQAGKAAPTTPSPGCKGIATALSNSDKGTKGQAALAVVSEKLGCATTPPPVDPMACPAGQTTMSNWVFDPNTGEYAYVDGSMTPSPNEYGGVDKGGFYIDGGPAPLSVVLQSTTGQVVTVTYGAGQQVETGQAISQNWFDPDVLGGRTGIQLIRFCA
jgi:hypothetical protein